MTLDEKIKQLKAKLEKVKGTETEVYTRIVGYYRPVKAFNDGQAAQRRNRKYFKVPDYK